MELEEITNVCREHECINCPFYEDELCDCIFDNIPLDWDLKEIERRLKNYGEKEN